MDKNLNDKWLLLKQYYGSVDFIYARKMSSVIGVDFGMNNNKRIIHRIATSESLNFLWIIDSTGQNRAISDFKAKSLNELLIALDLAGCLFDEPRIPTT